MKKIGFGLLALIVLLIGAAFIAPRLINWNGYKPEIAAAVRDATGRELKIAGDININLLPRATFSVADIRFANGAGMEPREMATIARIEGEIGLLGLISGAVDLKRLVISEPDIALAIDADGRPNWAFQGKAAPTTDTAAPDDDGPIGGLKIGELRIENGRIQFQDARTGQTIEAKGLQARAALPSLNEPLAADVAMTLNTKAVMLAVGIDAPQALLQGGRADVRLKLDAPDIAMAFDGRAQQKPAPGLDGTFSLDIPSAAKLAAWLDRPLPKGQPDPGPVKARAVFEADGAVVAIREATLQGDSLDARMTGKLDMSGDAPKLALDIKSGVLDIDRYLPPPVSTPRVAASQNKRPAAKGDPMAGLSDAPFDLTPLRAGTADVSIAIDGVKAGGLEIGAIRFGAKLASGILKAELAELNLYGGGVSGAFTADATSAALDIATDFKVIAVDAGALGAAATAGPSPVEGKVSATLAGGGAGESPRALAENLAGKLAVDLGGLDLGDAAAGAVSGLKINLDLPGVRQSPSLNGVVIYNKERVEFQARIDPLPEALANARFQADVSIASKPLTASYTGAILRTPVLGLDGTFKLAAPSVGRLAAWAGQPLPKGQPDPGPLDVEAVFAGAGEKITIQKAQIRGDGLRIDADGGWSKQGAITSIQLRARAGVIDLDRYLPASTPTTPTTRAPSKSVGGDGLLVGLSDAPLNFAPLMAYAADVDLAFDGLKASGQSIGKSALRLTLEKGVLSANLIELGIADGAVTGALKLDAARDTPTFGVTLEGTSLQLKAFAPDLTGVAAISIKANGAGRSPRALVSAATAKIGFEGRDLTIPGAPPRKLPRATLTAEIAGLEGPLKATGEALFEGEPVTISLETDPLAKIAGGERFALKFDLSAAPVKASYAGAILQTPAPGLDGQLQLNMPSVGKALAWFGQPLPKDQPDPGPLAIAATLVGDGAITRLESATIDGKAFNARASGSLNATGARPVIQAKIDVDQANLDAYLPPPSASPAAPAKAGWSTEPIDLSALSSADGDVIVNLKDVTFRGLKVESGRIDAKLKGGVLDATVTELRTASGAINAHATVDGSRATPRIAYKLDATGVNVRPILKAFAGSDRLSGRTELSVEGAARGAHQKALVSTLNGKGELHFFDGAIHGMNVAQTLREAGTLGLKGGADKKTDFAELGGTFTITNGIVLNNDLKMLAPLLRVSGKGPIDLPKRQIAYDVEAKLVDSLSGQGGKDGLAGLPIPIRIRGSFDDPSFQINWKAVLQSAALDPARLKDLPQDLLGQAKGLGVNLGNLGGAGGAKPADALKALPGKLLKGGGNSGGGSALDKLSNGLGGKKTPVTPKKTAPAPAPKPADAVKKLKGLFGG